MNAKAHIVYSNMPYREEYRLNGTLCEKSIEALINFEEEAQTLFDNASDAIAEIQEAYSQFPEEDCLTPVMRELRQIISRVRTASIKESLETLLSNVEDIANELQQSAEYGQEKLDSALKLLNEPFK